MLFPVSGGCTGSPLAIHVRGPAVAPAVRRVRATWTSRSQGYSGSPSSGIHGCGPSWLAALCRRQPRRAAGKRWTGGPRVGPHATPFVALAGSWPHPPNLGGSDVAIRLGRSSPFWEERGFRMPPTDTLQLIDGGAPTGELAILGIAPRPLPQLSRRPGDHLELHSFGSSEALAAIRSAAHRRPLDSETALALVIERCLVATEIEASAGLSVLEALDERGAGSRTHLGLWSAHSSYLHHLLGHCPAPPSKRPLQSPRVALPVRLIDRLGDWDLDLRGNPDLDLATAVDWEIAALLAGETMSEWAFRTLALELLG
jgi:hypothetical protein